MTSEILSRVRRQAALKRLAPEHYSKEEEEREVKRTNNATRNSLRRETQSSLTPSEKDRVPLGA